MKVSAKSSCQRKLVAYFRHDTVWVARVRWVDGCEISTRNKCILAACTTYHVRVTRYDASGTMYSIVQSTMYTVYERARSAPWYTRGCAAERRCVRVLQRRSPERGGACGCTYIQGREGGTRYVTRFDSSAWRPHEQVPTATKITIDQNHEICKRLILYNYVRVRYFLLSYTARHATHSNKALLACLLACLLFARCAYGFIRRAGVCVSMLSPMNPSTCSVLYCASALPSARKGEAGGRGRVGVTSTLYLVRCTM